MEQYSIVIPTMFKSTRIFEMLEKLNDCDAVGEIILIDNTESTTPHSEIPAYSKLRYINEGHNTGVNPAWNRGVELAKYELVALVSDDITRCTIYTVMVRWNGRYPLGLGNPDNIPKEKLG
jgi:glycosyltransferase involved in cell wall biosynthesis